jgi:hypothetical protein
MLSSGMITPPFFIFPENFTHSLECANLLFTLRDEFSEDLSEQGLNNLGIFVKEKYFRALWYIENVSFNTYYVTKYWRKMNKVCFDRNSITHRGDNVQGCIVR